MRRLFRVLAAFLVSVASGSVLLQDGCATGGYGYGDDCVGWDGYNWCVAGGGWGEIHEPSVQSWDFTDW